jgi:hypothetical protein
MEWVAGRGMEVFHAGVPGYATHHSCLVWPGATGQMESNAGSHGLGCLLRAGLLPDAYTTLQAQ